MKRSKFSLSHTKLLSCDTGNLIPIGLLEVLPGDTIQHNASLLIRCSPLLAPIMHKVDVRVHHWYVPNRLIWTGWEDFITGGPLGTDNTTPPQIVINPAPAVGSLYDYYGVPTGHLNTTVSALPFRGYNKIWNEFYRDQDLQTELTENTGNTNDDDAIYNVQRVAWEKDYFTAARPWEQKGPSITLPLGTEAPVYGKPAQAALWLNEAQTKSGNLRYKTIDNRFSWEPVVGGALADNEEINIHTVGGVSRVYADLSSASAITVNALREALALQRFEEARARYGSRYTEYLRYLGVRSSDARLQRPEYLGGGTAPIQFSEVLQTAEGTDPVGEMRGHGIGAMRSNRYRRFIEEHGFIHSFLSVRPKTIYSSGLHRKFTRLNKEEYWQKELEGIGQQEILNKEVKVSHATPDGVFGFIDRYQEYREEQSSIAGEFRSVLDHWHLARIFATDPALNASFVACAPADDRIFAVPSQDVLYVMAKHSIQARRLVSKTGKSFIF